MQDSPTQLNKVRERCVLLLGSLGGSINTDLVYGHPIDGTPTKAVVAWDTEQHLKFDVPFLDIKPTIYFGEIPRWFLALLTCQRWHKLRPLVLGVPYQTYGHLR